jgi:hypothetical protein
MHAVPFSLSRIFFAFGRTFNLLIFTALQIGDQMKEQLKDQRNLLIRLEATRDRLKAFVRDNYGLFNKMIAYNDEQLQAFAESHPQVLRFMAMTIVHETLQSKLQNNVDEVDISNGTSE